MTDENNQNEREEISSQLTFIERNNISPIFFAFLIISGLFVLYQGIGGIVTLIFVGFNFDETNVNLIRLLTIAGQIFLLLIPTLFFSKLVTHKVSEYLKINGANVLLYILTIVGIFSLQQILQVYLYFQDMIPLPDTLQETFKKLKESIESSYKLVAGAKDSKELLIVILSVVLVPSIVEETVFRGFFQSTIEKSLNPTKSIIISSIIFGVFHLNPINLIPLIIIGIYLGFIYYQSNSLIIPILAHFCNNIFAVISIYLGSEDETLIGIQENNISTGLLLMNFAFFGIIFLFSLYYFIKLSNLNSKKQ